MRTVTLLAVLLLTGCVREIVREVPVPATVPTLCVTACPWSQETPATNGALAEAWKERGDALVCMESRQACVREVTKTPAK